jgi:hypothetical protein
MSLLAAMRFRDPDRSRLGNRRAASRLNRRFAHTDLNRPSLGAGENREAAERRVSSGV